MIISPASRTTRAQVMVLMAIGLLALGTATGVGIDFARALNFKTALQGVADAAAIAGASIYLNNGYALRRRRPRRPITSTKPARVLPTNNGVSRTITVSQSAPWTVTVNANAYDQLHLQRVVREHHPGSGDGDGARPDQPQYRFLPAARFVAVDGNCGDAGRHQHDGRQYTGPMRQCARVPTRMAERPAVAVLPAMNRTRQVKAITSRLVLVPRFANPTVRIAVFPVPEIQGVRTIMPWRELSALRCASTI